MSEHLTGHQAVEHSRAGQRYAEVEAKQPPVLCIPVELEHETGEIRFSERSRAVKILYTSVYTVRLSVYVLLWIFVGVFFGR